jgi:hypothetical protein
MEQRRIAWSPLNVKAGVASVLPPFVCREFTTISRHNQQINRFRLRTSRPNQQARRLRQMNKFSFSFKFMRLYRPLLTDCPSTHLQRLETGA